ncbi:MAG: leucine--tRNA ligase [Alphaproteobacteria bacterium]|nr:leucine--tRNA ligase [Alphaproteobacteria bacterium]
MTAQKPYIAKDIENKWQKEWEINNTFKASSDSNKKNYYVLEMFPYPSGKIHMGHVRVYTLGDVLARYKRCTGYNVLHPMGWDAFGMPAENAAFENKTHPAIWTKQNIDNMRKQLKAMGLSYDWDLEFATCDPLYIECQQKIFLDFYKNKLAYRKEAWANWDPVDQTVLSNEQVIDGKGWRSGAKVERRKLPQWFFRITEYADELVDSLDKLDNWSNQVKVMQKNWIGRSEGLKLNFTIHISAKIPSEFNTIEVYTTRPDTIYGASFIAIAPDHPIAKSLSANNNELQKFITECNQIGTSEEALEKAEKRGFDTGIKVCHPFIDKEYLPVYVANFVLMSYGTGAIFGVPAHDQRDLDFANKLGLPIRVVVRDKNNSRDKIDNTAYTGEGEIINSGFLNGLNIYEAKARVMELAEEKKIGKKSKQFRLHDWCASRQRYWGCPVPIVLCDDCGIVPIPKSELPVLLPDDVTFEKAGNPLDHHEKWKSIKCPKCNKPAKRETQTFDTFVDSSWYALRYPAPKSKEPIEKNEMTKWSPPDQYVGGIEHAILHLLYARFFNRGLKKTNYVNFEEPFKGLFCQGMVCHKTYKGPDGWVEPENIIFRDNKALLKSNNQELEIGRSEKMSKSKKNIVDPMSIIEKYGADTARLFMLSDSPPERDLDWSENGVDGCWKYLKKIWSHFQNYEIPVQNFAVLEDANEEGNKLRRDIYICIKNATDSIESFRYNSAVASIRKLSNLLLNIKNKNHDNVLEQIILEGWQSYLIMLSPIAPHITEELWKYINPKTSILNQSWPSINQKLLNEKSLTIAVQINGKLKNTIEIPKKEINNKAFQEEKALSLNNIKAAILINAPKKIIVIPGRVINIVI